MVSQAELACQLYAVFVAATVNRVVGNLIVEEDPVFGGGQFKVSGGSLLLWRTVPLCTGR